MDKKTDALTNFFNSSLLDLADFLHYNEENKVILRGDATTFYTKYPKTVAYLNGKDASFRRDNRNPYEFCYNLIINWLIEDYMGIKLSTLGYKTNYNAHDRNREIISKGVTTDPDLRVFIDNRWVPIEIQSDYSGWVQNGGTLCIKEGKYKNLIKKNAMLLQISIPNKSFCLIPTNKLLNPTRRGANPGMGNKMCVYFDNLNLVFSPFDNQVKKTDTITYIPTATTAEKITERLTPTPNRHRKRDTVVVSTKMLKTELF